MHSTTKHACVTKHLGVPPPPRSRAPAGDPEAAGAALAAPWGAAVRALQLWPRHARWVLGPHDAPRPGHSIHVWLPS